MCARMSDKMIPGVCLATVGLILALPARAAAQSATASVVPGIAVSVAPPQRVDTVVYQRSITRAGKDTTAGTRTVVSRVVDASDRRQLLEVEQRFPAGNGEIVDTAVAELRTLRAVAHRSHQPTRTMRFDFTGSDADGNVTDAAAGGGSVPTTKGVHQPLGGPIFDSNVIDLVVASLPLAPNFSTELPFFIYERGGRVPMRVAVRERANVDFPKLGNRDAWIVTVGVPGAPATVWVDAKTHAVLRVRYDIAARATSFTDDRITPLPTE
jgi:hypothetical protein